MSDYDLGTARGRITIDASGAVKGAAVAEGAVGKVWSSSAAANSSLLKVGGAATAAGGLIAAGFGYAVNQAASFEQVISGIGAVTGANGKDLDALRSKALQLGKDTVFSADEAASAIEELAKAGISVPNILNGAADSAVALAAAGGIDIPTAAGLASNAMNAFNLKAGEMKGAVDDIAGAANASAIDVGDYGMSLKQVGAVAHLVGANFHDTSTAIAEMGNAGIKGSDAGTSLKTMFMNLIPTTQQQVNLMQDMGLLSVNASGAMKKLAVEGIKPASGAFEDIIYAIAKHNEAMGGFKASTMNAQRVALQQAQTMGVVRNQFFDAKGDFAGLRNAQDILATSTQNMTKQQKLSALQTLFGSDAIRGAAVLANEGAKGYDKMSGAINKTSAADVAKKRMDNFAGSMEQLKGSLQTLAISVGEILLPAIRKLVDILTWITNKFLALPGPVKIIIVIIMALVSAVLLIGGAILTAIALFGMWTAATAALDVALGPIILTVGLVVLAIAAIITIIVLVIKYHHQIWNAIKTVWNAIWGLIKRVVGDVVGFVRDHWKLLLAILTGPIGLAVLFFVKHWDRIKGIFSGAVDWIKNAVSSGFHSMINGVEGIVSRLVHFVGTLPKKILDALGDLGHILYDAGKKILGGLIHGITSKLGDLKGLAGSIGHKLVSWKGPPEYDSRLLTDNGSRIMQSLMDGLDSQMPALRSMLSDVTMTVHHGVSPAIAADLSSRSRAIPGGGASTTNNKETNVTINSYNPVAERTSESVAREMRTQAALGVI